MRFDDRFSTVLSDPAPSGPAAVAQWRQLIDLMAQAPADLDHAQIAAALVRAHTLRAAVSEDARIATVSSLGGRMRSPTLLRYLAHDRPRVAAAAVRAARLSDEQWAELIPEMPTPARGFLRNRSDLGPRARHALEMHAAADFVLFHDETVLVAPVQDGVMPRVPDIVPGDSLADLSAGQEDSADTYELEEALASPDNAPRHAPPPPAGGDAIRALVERIEAFRRSREGEGSAFGSEAPQLPLEGGQVEPLAPIDRFEFETDDEGTILWIDGAPRGAIVGTSIAEPVYGDGPGPDAHAAAAFRQRMPISQARMRLLGAEAIEGDWRIEASPWFDDATGRFRGYRGVMRRPTSAEDARLPLQEDGRADRLRQLVHELRTPLGAIIGFGEIIEQQLFGPVSSEYRALAGTILEDARRLLAGFDDLDMAARLDSGALADPDGLTDPDWLTRRLADRLQTLTDSRQISLNLVNVSPLRPFAIENETSERIFARLISAVVLACEPGETLSGTLRTRVGARPQNQFLLSRPARFAGLSEDELLDGGLERGEDSAAPLLGLAFSLRLVRSLARNSGGDLRFHDAGLLLTLPAAADSQVSERG